LRRWLPWIGLGIVVAGVVAYAAWPRTGDQSVRAHVQRLASELRCVDCQGLSVADSATSTARATRRDLAARIRRGESDAEIRQVYVDRYGEAVLLKPASGGLGAVVWALPVAVILIAAGGLVLALRRWQREPTLVASPEDEELVARERAGPGAAERDLP
jgi:cytochrome c-type biogenesis protein CcmH